RIKNIAFFGNNSFKPGKLRAQLKKTKDIRLLHIFSSTKFKKKEYQNDKEALIEFYNNNGFRDARLVKDSVYSVKNNRLNIELHIDEGKKYYFRNITWRGNNQYPTALLDSILRIKKGTPY